MDSEDQIVDNQMQEQADIEENEGGRQEDQNQGA